MSRFKPTADYRIFLDLLIQERRDRNVSQEEIATRLSLSPAQVAKFELGERQLDFVQTRDWCVALSVPFLEFMVNLDREISAPFLQGETPDANAKQEGGPQ